MNDLKIAHYCPKCGAILEFCQCDKTMEIHPAVFGDYPNTGKDGQVLHLTEGWIDPPKSEPTLENYREWLKDMDLPNSLDLLDVFEEHWRTS